MPKRQIPSIFEPGSDAKSDDPTAAPAFVYDMTAAIMGALIAAKVLDYTRYSWHDTLEITERLIAETIDQAMDRIDPAEITSAIIARNPGWKPWRGERGDRD